MKWISLIFTLTVTLISLSLSPHGIAQDKNVQVGDLIQVDLPGESSLNRGFQVDKRGRINLPEVGQVFVAGYDEEQLKTTVTQALSQMFRDTSNIKVFIAERQILISVQGYVKAPGEYTIPYNANVQMALQAAGGLRAGAQLNKMLHRRGADRTEFDYKRFLDSGDDDGLPTYNLSTFCLFLPLL
ncbi:periplasmic protein SypC [Vibrio variabilis]|uniref:Periplasmic protein SypC n=1 Tax=Vibrio variabilis TaxID=990271 RepID=A0ABQ0JA31_9VIBR|nr:periplasmic protein SypC [Vibrio variabilis]